MKKITHISILVAIALVVFSFTNSNENSWKTLTVTEYEGLVAKTADYLNGKTPFSVDMQISSYKTHTSTAAFETSHARYTRSGDNYHMYMIGLHSYQNKKYRFVVDTVRHLIMIAGPETEESRKPLLETYQSMKKHITSYKVLSLDDKIKLHIEFDKKVKLSHVEMELDKEGLPLKSVTYIRTQLSEDPTNPKAKKSAPRIETIFTNYKKNIKVDYNEAFSDSPFFIQKGEKFIGVGKYKNYKVHDTRLKTK